jgi:hypothetical protein
MHYKIVNHIDNYFIYYIFSFLDIKALCPFFAFAFFDFYWDDLWNGDEMGMRGAGL